MKVHRASDRRISLTLPRGLKRRKPRSFLEWKTLKGWGVLPDWEETRPGYLLRLWREEAGLTQEEMGSRLGCSQQAVAQAESWGSNPTVRFLQQWATALGCELKIELLSCSSASSESED